MHFITRPTGTLACPECISASPLHRSRVRFHERLVQKLTGFTPYRCHHCGWRVWVYEAAEPGNESRSKHLIS